MTRLLLVGGGHAHAVVLRQFAGFPAREFQLRLVTPHPLHTYSGMVPGVVAGHYQAADARIDLARPAARAGVELILGEVRRLNADAKQVELASGETFDYDVVSLNLGSMPEGTRAHAIAVKPFESFFARWRWLLENGPKAPRIAVVGAGAGGVELAMAMKYALDQRGTGSSVVLFSERNAF